MKLLVYFLMVLPCALTQFPGFGVGGGGFQQGSYGGGFPGSQGIFGGERSYHVRGRLVCGMQGAQGARVSLWEKRGTPQNKVHFFRYSVRPRSNVLLGSGSPFVYAEAMTDVSGSFYVKAEIRSGGGWNVGGGNSYLTLTINHSCEGLRQMSVVLPTSYFNQGLAAVKTFDLGTINLEGRFSGEETNGFTGGGRLGGFGTRFGSGFGSGFGGGMIGAPVQL